MRVLLAICLVIASAAASAQLVPPDASHQAQMMANNSVARSFVKAWKEHNADEISRTLEPNATLFIDTQSRPLDLASLGALPECEAGYTLRNVPLSAGKWSVASDEVALIWSCAARERSKLTLHFANARIVRADYGVGQIMVYNPGAKK